MGKDTPINEFKIFCIAVCILLLCEVTAPFLMSGFSTLATLAVIRSAQIIFLLLLLGLISGGFKFAGLSKKNYGPGFKIGLIWSFIFGILVSVTGFIVYLTGTNPLQFILPTLPRTHLVLFFITGGLISPIAEEIFFRGILYSFFRRLGIITAILFTSVIFALFHLSHGGLPMVQLMGGLLFALSFEYSKSLVTPIVIHVLGNLVLFSMALIL